MLIEDIVFRTIENIAYREIVGGEATVRPYGIQGPQITFPLSAETMQTMRECVERDYEAIREKLCAS